MPFLYKTNNLWKSLSDFLKRYNLMPEWSFFGEMKIKSGLYQGTP